jgi:hypothetical protein
MVPTLAITDKEYRDFQEGVKVFNKWVAARTGKLRNNFIGVVQQVAPRFEIALVEGTLFYTFKGFTLVYKECLIDNTFFEDYVYVLLSAEMQREMNFHDQDTVSGVGHFHIDERGFVTINMPSKLKTVIPSHCDNYWNTKTLSQLSMRYVDYLHEDKCMKCPWALLNTEWHPHRKRHVNRLCCTIEECRAPENWE